MHVYPPPPPVIEEPAAAQPFDLDAFIRTLMRKKRHHHHQPSPAPDPNEAENGLPLGWRATP